MMRASMKSSCVVAPSFRLVANCKPSSLSAKQRIQRRGLIVMNSAEAAQIIEDATAMYLAGDRMSAIRRYEQALLKDPTVEQRQECLYASTCVHASFGDLELAKMTLRDAIVAGLDWDSAVMRTDYVPFTASTQVKIQLRAFAEMVVKQMAQQQRQSATGSASSSSRAASAGGLPNFSRESFTEAVRNASNQNAEELLGTKMADGMDASVGAIFKRVALLLLVGAVAGTVLFYGGLATLFPEDQRVTSPQSLVEDF